MLYYFSSIRIAPASILPGPLLIVLGNEKM